MASLFSSVLQFHNTLTAGNFPGGVVPPAYEKPAPQVTAAGAQLRPPYVVYSLVALEDVLTFEDDGFECYALTATAYADSQGDADTIISCIRFNGQSVGTAAGMDNRSTLTNFSDGTLLSICATKPPVPSYSGVGISAQRVHQSSMEWRIEVQRS